MIIIKSLLQNSIRTLYAMNFNNILLMLLIELVTFYMVRNRIINKVQKKWTILVWHPTLAGILKKSLLTLHLLYAIYGILVFCPISDTTANPIPLYALYQLLMHGKLEALTLCLYNTVLMFPVGLWLGEIFKPARSSFLYKWTAILTGIIGIYLEYSQYVLEKGRPAADDLICIMIACCAGIFFRDAYEKIKQYYKLADQVVRNEKNKRIRAKEKEEKKKAEAARVKKRDEELEKIDEMAQQEEKEKKRKEGAEKLQKRKEAAEPYIEKVTGSTIYRKSSDIAAVLVYFLLASVQWLAELVADKNVTSEDDFDEDVLEVEEIEGEPRWKKLKRQNEKQAKNPMMKKSRRMRREAMRKLRAQEDVDKELEEEKAELESQAEMKALKELERELKISRLFRKLEKERDEQEDLDELEDLQEDLEDMAEQDEQDNPDELEDLKDFSEQDNPDELKNLKDFSDQK